MQKAIWKTIYNSTYVKKKNKAVFIYICVCVYKQPKLWQDTYQTGYIGHFGEGMRVQR